MAGGSWTSVVLAPRQPGAELAPGWSGAVTILSLDVANVLKSHALRAALALAAFGICAHGAASAAADANVPLRPGAPLQHAPASLTDGAPGRLVVGFAPGRAAAGAARVRALDGVVVEQEMAEIDAVGIRVPVGQERSLLATLRADPLVAYVEPDVVVTSEHTDCRGNPACRVPDDPLFHRQWYLQNDPQTVQPLETPTAVFGADINAPLGWNVAFGSAGTRIAVVDSGVDPVHPDLAGRIASSQTLVGTDGSASDNVGHGTMVAGVIAANWNNAIGIAGVNPTARLDIVKDTSDASDAITGSAMAKGIIAAVNVGAQVINLSQGSSTYSSAVEAAVNYAWSQNALVVASAGNSGSTSLRYPAANANALSVGATDNSGRRAPFSHYGSWVLLTAPGVRIVTTVPTYPTDTIANPDPAGTLPYAYVDGTSFSAPMVSAAAALIWSSTTDANANGFTNDDVVRRLLESAEPGPDVGTTSRYGALNLCRAIAGPGAEACSIPAPPPPPAIAQPSAGDAAGAVASLSTRPQARAAAATVRVPAGRYRRYPTEGSVTLTVDRNGRISQAIARRGLRCSDGKKRTLRFTTNAIGYLDGSGSFLIRRTRRGVPGFATGRMRIAGQLTNAGRGRGILDASGTRADGVRCSSARIRWSIKRAA